MGGGREVRKKRRKQIVSILVAFMMLSLISPNFARAEATRGMHTSLKQEQNVTKEKINNQLLSQFKDDDKVTFLIKFKEQVDTNKVALQAKEDAKKASLTVQKTKFLQRSAVVSELKAAALETQYRVKAFLEEEEQKGNVEDIRSYFIVNGMAVTATKEVAEKLASFEEIDKILPNEVRQLETTQTIGRQVTLPGSKTNQIEWNIDRVKAPQTWALGIDGTGTVVASIDTGVQWDHPALKEKYRGYDPATGTVDHRFNWFDATAKKTAPYDDQGHGTHVTGTMVGSEPNGSNQIGVAPGAKWIAVKAFTAAGGTDANLLAAGEWILAPTDAEGNVRVDMAPDVVNNSWGGGPGMDEWYRPMVQNWRAAEIFPEFSAGNTSLFNPGGPGSIANPANYPESFATGATNNQDKLANFSLQGPSPYNKIKPDIAAPGVNIRSSVPGGKYEGGWNGTSMAGPHVSAVAALLRQVDASLSVDDMEKILLDTAIPLTDSTFPSSPNNGYGHGLVNAYDAVVSIQNGLGKIEGQVQRASAGNDKAAHVPREQTPAVKDELVNPAFVPIRAQVSVLESGRSVFTDPENGRYSLSHASGSYTIQAEAYGYHSKQQSVNVASDSVTTANFVLEEMKKYTINGVVKDSVTGEPIEGAKLLLIEDAAVAPVITDEKGQYSITAYEGTYTLKVLAPSYHSQEVNVNIEQNDAAVNVELEPFFSYPGGEIGYDDGNPDNARAFYEAGNGWAVKMSLPEGKESGIVTDGVFRFWNTEWPVPGGTEFEVEVWDATGVDGAPGKKIAGPVKGTALRNDEWTVVDLSDKGIVVDGDFYMVYIQTKPNPYAPGLATDESSPNAKRSWQYVDGAWSKSPIDEGNYMIRARVSYEVAVPVIKTPEDGFITNESKVIVEGTSSPTTKVIVKNNDVEAASMEIGEDGKFSVEVDLNEGENILTAVSYLNDTPTGQSTPVTVILDTEVPELTIDNPKDGDKISSETITVEGSVEPKNLESVKVNGSEAKVVDGKYSKRIMLDAGENEIEVVAQYKSGNTAVKKIKVYSKYEAPVIENLQPTADKNLKAGESVKIEFDSEPGLKASFVIHMPLTNTGQVANATELPMMETSDGHYVGYWTATSNVVADGAAIEVKAVDSFDNETRQVAAGKLFINVNTNSDASLSLELIE